MKTIALFAALPLLAGCGQKPGATGIDPQDAAKVARGQAVYSASCAACHGANLEGQPDWRSRKPDGRMPAFGSLLSDEDIAAALSFIQSRWPPEVRRVREEMLRNRSR